jgi:hypothetical protein
MPEIKGKRSLAQTVERVNLTNFGLAENMISLFGKAHLQKRESKTGISS